MRSLHFALTLLAALPLIGCAGTRTLTDPVLRITTEGGAELGVATDHGVVFLGRSAARGGVGLEAVFGDGPSLERSVTEPVGGGKNADYIAAKTSKDLEFEIFNRSGERRTINEASLERHQRDARALAADIRAWVDT